MIALCCGSQHAEVDSGVFAVVLLFKALLQASVVLLLLFLPCTTDRQPVFQAPPVTGVFRDSVQMAEKHDAFECERKTLRLIIAY